MDTFGIIADESNCEVYAALSSRLHPICMSLNAADISPPLYQATDCYSSLWDTSQTILSLTGDGTQLQGYSTLQYSPYEFDGIVGSSLLDIRHTLGYVYGSDEYFDDTLRCYNGTQLRQDIVNDTIPILATDFDKCNYIDLITKFQEFGSRAVVILYQTQYPNNH